MYSILTCIAQSLDALGFQNAAHSISNPTLIFMPHCDISLYENMLRQNWSIHNLPNMFFIANQFQDYVDRYGPFPRNQYRRDPHVYSIPKRRLAVEFPCLMRFGERGSTSCGPISQSLLFQHRLCIPSPCPLRPFSTHRLITFRASSCIHRLCRHYQMRHFGHFRPVPLKKRIFIP
jgi:hypothetical protein